MTVEMSLTIIAACFIILTIASLVVLFYAASGFKRLNRFFINKKTRDCLSKISEVLLWLNCGVELIKQFKEEKDESR